MLWFRKHMLRWRHTGDITAGLRFSVALTPRALFWAKGAGSPHDGSSESASGCPTWLANWVAVACLPGARRDAHSPWLGGLGRPGAAAHVAAARPLSEGHRPGRPILCHGAGPSPLPS